MKRAFHKALQSASIDWRRGSGSVFVGMSMIVLCAIFTLLVITEYSVSDTVVRSQMVTDAIADGSSKLAKMPHSIDEDVLIAAANQIAEYNETDAKYTVRAEVTEKTDSVAGGVFTNTISYTVETATTVGTQRVPIVHTSEAKISAITSVADSQWITSRHIKSVPFPTTKPGQRSAFYVNWFIDDYLAVDLNPAYEMDTSTYCNIFMHDYLVCLGFDGARDAPYKNRTSYKWYVAMIQSVITGEGKYYDSVIANDGWYCVLEDAKEGIRLLQEDPESAAEIIQNAANQGKPVIGLQHDHLKSGSVRHHCFVVVPQRGELKKGEIAIAEAGGGISFNTNYRVLTLGEGRLATHSWDASTNKECAYCGGHSRYEDYPATMIWIAP